MTTRQDILRAVLWMSGAVASFLTMAFAGRALSTSLDTFEIMTWRSLTGVAIMVTLITLRGSWGKVSTRRMGLQIGRNIAHFTGQNLWFFAVASIPIAQVFALEFTSPLWVLVLSPLVLGERLTTMRVLAAGLGFIGILMVTRPGAQELSPGVIAAACCAIAFAVTMVTTKRLTRDVSTLSIIFWMTVTQTVMGLICGGYDLDFALPTAQTLPLLVLVGCCGLFAHFCVTTALSFAPATVVVPIDFTRLPLAALLGVLFASEPFDLWVLAGAVVIFAGNVINIRSETRPRVAAS
ncbi:Permease of the drug/metabolite transporter (DMT) superfamily [Pseudooceanicola antarcticus]|uniref:Permease of the drug/metabolite transporter (DMT) superfamily n=2 Tax=Pseudooceanicola antarcticus TaxID=1247613 RepID=A0A285IWV3_9RHOB|nr:DMT family transporter [Pseudooceanicola antarcticus]SNY52303.1 Permease of the drug/metabolite transporter (DMT) superfamily [Pseudooceanicola antarcticus]